MISMNTVIINEKQSNYKQCAHYRKELTQHSFLIDLISWQQGTPLLFITRERERERAREREREKKD